MCVCICASAISVVFGWCWPVASSLCCWCQVSPTFTPTTHNLHTLILVIVVVVGSLNCHYYRRSDSGRIYPCPQNLDSRLTHPQIQCTQHTFIIIWAQQFVGCACDNDTIIIIRLRTSAAIGIREGTDATRNHIRFNINLYVSLQFAV